MIQKSSTEQRIFKEGDSRAYRTMSYRQVKSPPGGGPPRLAPISLPSRPTSLPISRPAGLRSPPRFYWSRLSRAQQRSRADGHRSGLRTTITEASSISESMPPTDGNWQRNIPRSTARRLGGEQARLNLLSITIFGKVYMSDVDE